MLSFSGGSVETSWVSEVEMTSTGPKEQAVTYSTYAGMHQSGKKERNQKRKAEPKIVHKQSECSQMLKVNWDSTNINGPKHTNVTCHTTCQYPIIKSSLTQCWQPQAFCILQRQLVNGTFLKPSSSSWSLSVSLCQRPLLFQEHFLGDFCKNHKQTDLL